MSAIIIQDRIVHYEVLGRGRPVVFLHGWVGSWRYWIPAMQHASMRYRAYALDFWGFGDSDKDTNFFGLDSQTHLLAAFLEELGIAKVVLIGHGLGAIVSLIFGLRYPPAVDRMMLIGLPSDEKAINPRLFSDSPSKLAEWLLKPSINTKAARLEAPKAHPEAIAKSAKDFTEQRLFSHMRAMTIPTLLVHGRNDPLISAPTSAIMETWPENVHQITFESSGHFPMLDEPSKFNRLLTDFLLLPSGASPKQLQLKEEWKRRVR